MSDDPQSIELPRTPAGIVDHWCEHPGCKRWGSWGFRRGRETTWRCYEHREEE